MTNRLPGWLGRLLPLCLVLHAGAVAAQAARPESAPAAAPAAAAASAPGAADNVRRHAFSALGGGAVIPLRSTDGQAVLRFGTRSDELVTRAVLKLRYSWSPALIANLSHLKVLLNDEVVATLPLPRENAGKSQAAELELDPRLVAEYNALTLQFIGHYAMECEDPLHSSLWAQVSGASAVELTVRALPATPDLARLPEPFFDARDNRRLELPFVLAARPSRDALQAAAVTASWFGSLAAWRGTRFPVAAAALPAGHAVVIATNAERPAALAGMPPFAGPELRVAVNPADPNGALLVIGGRDAGELRTAALALARGGQALSGTRVTVKDTRAAAPRKPYDAPNWVRLDRPMRFGELVEDVRQLQVTGHTPEPIRLNLRIPPDLFVWNSHGIPVELKYRYSPPLRPAESRLTMAVNDELVRAFNLLPDAGASAARVQLPLLAEGMVPAGLQVRVPAFQLGSRNQLQYAFSFSYQKEGACRESPVDNVRAAIDPDSTIDFSGHPHYAHMPNLRYFADAGFPFTKYADLAQTTAVLPDAPATAEIATLLGVMGRFGAATGYPATGVRVAGPGDANALKDRDLLLVGSRLPLLAAWRDRLPATLEGGTRSVSLPADAGFPFGWRGMRSGADPAIASTSSFAGGGPLALVLGFESPVAGARSVVALTASEPSLLPAVLDALDGGNVSGSAAFVRGKRVDSVLSGATYTVGELPWWTAVWYAMSRHPILLGLLAVAAVLVFAFALWRSLRAIAARRLRAGQ